MSLDITKLKNYANIMGKGALRSMAPSLVAGAIEELMKEAKLDKGTIDDYVINNRSLFENLSPKAKRKLKYIGGQIGNIEWLTVDWLGNNIRKKHPLLVSRFRTSPESQSWLQGQIEELKALLYD